MANSPNLDPKFCFYCKKVLKIVLRYSKSWNLSFMGAAHSVAFVFLSAAAATYSAAASFTETTAAATRAKTTMAAAVVFFVFLLPSLSIHSSSLTT